MTEINLTQQEADALLAMPKFPEVADPAPFPSPGQELEIRLLSKDSREAFLLNLRRNRFEVGRATYQSRARVIVVLARLDLHGAPTGTPTGCRFRGRTSTSTGTGLEIVGRSRSRTSPSLILVTYGILSVTS